MTLPNRSTSADWPELPFTAWSDTAATLHMWTQIVGKVRLVQTPWTNHSWHVALYVTARGLGTSPIACGGRVFDMEFDFVGHRLAIRTTDGAQRDIPLLPRSVADFYGEVFECLRSLDLDVRIHTTPSEVPDAIPFDRDTRHHHYDREFATRFWRALVQADRDTRHHHYDREFAARFWRALVQADRVFKEFRARFLGKCSPVHFFWGSLDLAVTRFSGREAPPHPGGIPNFPDRVAREAYSHEVSSAGFWPGGSGIDHAAFYSYAYPQPPGFAEARVRPAAASWSSALGEFLLPYDDVRTAASPDELLLEFLQSSYEAAADRAGWNRAALERRRLPHG